MHVLLSFVYTVSVGNLNFIATMLALISIQNITYFLISVDLFKLLPLLLSLFLVNRVRVLAGIKRA